MTDNVNKLDTFSKIIIIGIVLIALANAYLHDPNVGYDADDYAAYILSIAQGDLPERGINDEFFTPPLPFVLPALIERIFHPTHSTLLKVAQFLNVLVALGSILTIARISNRLTNGNDTSRNLSLLFILILPVFYKTHAFVRAEPYLVLFILLYVEQLIRVADEAVDLGSFAITSGSLFGAVMLSRQWGVLIVPGILLYALLLFIQQAGRRRKLAGAFMLSGIIAFLLSSWFYLSLFSRYGSMTAFNRQSEGEFSLRNKPASFYIGTGSGYLFTDPVRDSFDRQLLPILYSETWGDYWEYFLVYGKDIQTGDPVQGGLLHLALQKDDWNSSIRSNRYAINQYLGRVNLVALLPTAIAVASFTWGLAVLLRTGLAGQKEPAELQITLLGAMILSTLIGYLWFIIQYPTTDGDTIKATYILQIFPFIALLIGLFGKRLTSKWEWSYWIIAGVFLLTLVHNAGALITRIYKFPL